ncbi:MAG: hypothetical protein LBF94_02255 [Puniceicoccales bacterium]|nr:hypothetical protein [Puniceicoccales bacterium]
MDKINKTNHGQVDAPTQVPDVSKMNFLQRLIAVIQGKITIGQAFAGSNLSDRTALVANVTKELEEIGTGNLPTDLGIDPGLSPGKVATELVSMALEQGGDDSNRIVSKKPENISESVEVADIRLRLIEAGKHLREMISQTEDRRAAAQLYLILTQIENVANHGNANEIRTILGAVEKILEGGQSPIQEAVKEANGAEERAMERNGINIRSDQSNVVEGNLKWEQTFRGQLQLPWSLCGNERPNFSDLALGKGYRSQLTALRKFVGGIEHVLGKPDNKCAAFLAIETAKNAAGNRDFDLPIRFKADLLSQLDPKRLDAIEDMAEKHPEEFKAFAILAALCSHFGTGDQSGYFSPQLPPSINPVVQAAARMLRNGNITAQDLNETFGELLKEINK